MKKTKLTVLLSSIALALGVFSVVAPKQKEKVSFAYYTNGDAATYYNTIDDTQSGNTLLTALRNLNLSKRQSTVGYSSMGTTPSGMFKYTDYDPNYVQYDSNGQPYGTRISSFYTYTSATSWNREHVWPNSHGGGNGGDAGSPYPDADIHMPRPTISSENSSRGNSFFVEGMNHSSNGWDPYTAGYSAESRGEAARITFYTTLVNSKLILAPSNTTPSGTDSVTGQSFGSGHTMGNLETLIKWNINYPVTQRERNRNEGAEYLQGNRNAFVDHPEYACKIWGNVNTNIKNMCASASWDTGNSVTISKSSASITVDDTTTINATASDSSTITWTTSDATVADISTSSSASGANITITAIGPGTATITARATISGNAYTATCAVTVTTSGGGGGGGGDIPSPTGYTRLTSIANIDTSATYVLGLDGTGFHYSGTSSWGLVALPSSQTPLYYTLTPNSGNTSFTAKTVINNSTYYLTVPTSNGFAMSTSSANVTLGTSTTDSDGEPNYAVTCPTNSTRHLRINGSNGLRSYSNTTGAMAYFYRVDQSTDPVIESISVKTAPTKTVYLEGETFNPAGLVIHVSYSDNTSEDVAYSGHESDFDFDPDLNTSLSTSVDSVTIYYGDAECNQEITVNAKTLSSISISTAPTKTAYYAGDNFDPTGLVITRHYSNSTSDTYTYSGHTSEFSFSPSLSTTLTTSNTSVTITYSGKSTTQNITVSAVTLSSISVSTAPTKTTYTEGEYFDPTGLVITRNYNNSTSDTYPYSGHTSEFTFTPNTSTALTTSNTSVTITYGGKSTTQLITVNSSGGGGGGDDDSGSQRISANQNSKYYQSGDIYLTGDEDSATSACDAFDVSWLRNDATNAIANSYDEIRIYGGHSFTISPKDGYAVTSIVITANSSSYASAIGGSSLSNCTKSVSGSTVTITPNDEKTAVTFANSAQSRINYIVVDYLYVGSGTVTPTLTSISINTSPTKLTYTAGEYFDPTGLVITRYFENSSPDNYTYEDHEANFLFEPALSTPLSVSNTSITIIHSGKSTELTITVNPVSSEEISASVDRTFYVGETIYDSDIIVVDSDGNEVDESEFVLDEYTFTYDDAPSGGEIVYKTFTHSVHQLDTDNWCDLVVPVARKEYRSAYTVSYTDLPTTYSTSVEERTASSGVKFIAYNCANYSSKMQFKASGGYFQTTQSMPLSILRINNRETNTLTVYAGTTSDNITTQITGSNDVYNLSGYYFFKIIRNSSNAAYCSSIDIMLEGYGNASNVANYIMYEDTNNQCSTKFDKALEYLSELVESELSNFQTSNDYVVLTARTRLEAWAAHLGRTINYETNNVTASAIKNVLLTQTIVKDENTITIILVVISALAISAGYYLYRKRKHD